MSFSCPGVHFKGTTRTFRRIKCVPVQAYVRAKNPVWSMAWISGWRYRQDRLWSASVWLRHNIYLGGWRSVLVETSRNAHWEQGHRVRAKTIIDTSSLKDCTQYSSSGEPSAIFGQLFSILMCYHGSNATAMGEDLLDILLMLNLHTLPGGLLRPGAGVWLCTLRILLVASWGIFSRSLVI
jgi:hypothetical protein